MAENANMKNSDQESLRYEQNAFLRSRNGAILRCAEIMVDAGRKDLAKQILLVTHIDKKRLKELKVNSQV